MVAVVVADGRSRRRLSVERFGKLCLIRAGDKVGALRLKRAVGPFGGDFILSDGVGSRGLRPFDPGPYREEMLFRVFERYVMSRPGTALKIGIRADAAKYYGRLIPLIGHAAQTVICTRLDADGFCAECLVQVGVCPEIVSDGRHLAECTAVFAPDGLNGFCGELFGRGGIALSPRDFPLPAYCREAVKSGADAIDLAALLSFEEKRLLSRETAPRYVYTAKGEISVEELCAQKTPVRL